MKFNKWTLGLAAVGVVSLTSAVQADESKISQLDTALSNTTISGYVDVAAQFNPGNGGASSAGPNYNFGAADNSFNLNVVDIAIDKPMDESPWASGYHVELWFGPDAAALGTSQAIGNRTGTGNNTGYNAFDSAAIRQAYITLRTPVGNCIDWKLGIWDTIIGYEGTTSGSNPNYSRSFGYNMEPTTHTGIQGTYKINDVISVTAGVADTSYAGDGSYSAVPNNGLYQPTIMGLVTLTAPDNFGWAKGATLAAGVINTSGNLDDIDTGKGSGATSWYAGVTLPTPVAALKFGAAFDYLNARDIRGNEWDLALYGTYQFNDKTSFNMRAEHMDVLGSFDDALGSSDYDEITATLQYNLWANVLTRLEVRWDHAESGDPYVSHGSNAVDEEPAGTPNSNAFLLAAQAIYTF